MTSPQPPSRDQRKEFEPWRASVVAWQLLFRALDKQTVRDLGIPHAHYVILLALLNQDGSTMALTALARHLGYSQSRLSHAVTRLEALGWVARSVNADDRRVSMLTLTPEGRAAIRDATPAHFAEVRQIFLSALDETDLQDAHRIAVKLIENLAATDANAAYFRGVFRDGVFQGVSGETADPPAQYN